LTDASGSTPDTLRFTLDPADRPPGTYRDAIILVPDSSPTRSVRVPIELRISPGSPSTGDLAVRVGTTGATPDPDGYTVTVDGAQSHTLAINDTTVYVGLAPRTYTVQLSGLAPNCTVPAGATQPVTVAAGQTATVTFSVSCPTTPPPTGTLKVKASTTGATPDPNGYTVTIDGDSSRTIANNDSTTYTLVAGTSYLVQLGDVASNCTVTGGPSQPKTVIAGQTVTATFTVTCPTPPPPTGDLTVTTSTTGSSFDPDGYTVAVDGGTPQSIGINNSTGITFTGLTPASHTVALGDVASNCTVTGGPSQTKTVIAGQTVTAPFTVTCTTTPPPTGDLTVSATTTGGTPDPDGYTVTVNGDTRRILSGASTTYTLVPGSYTVALGDVASDCTVNGGPSQTKAVTAGQTVTATFTVDCPTPPPPTGTLTVSASTTPGGTPDANGYTVTVNGGQLRTIGINGSTTYDLAPASYTVDLGDIASNCTVTGGTSRTVTVTAGQPTSVPFAVDCPTPPPPTGNLTVGATTTGGTPDPNGYTVTLDGGQLRNIGNNGSTPYTDLTPGTHVVALGDVASNCTVSGGASHTVTVVSGQTTTETFAVDCPTPPPPPATHLAFTQQPPNTIVLSNTFSVTVTALNDQSGVATGFTGLVQVTLQGPIQVGGLSGTTTLPAVGGVANFTNLSITGLCLGCHLVATASGLTGATSSAFDVVLGLP